MRFPASVCGNKEPWLLAGETESKGATRPKQATTWAGLECWAKERGGQLRATALGASVLNPGSRLPSPTGLPERALFGARARYPFLEVGSPLVILPDHDLNAAFPVLPFRGDGLWGDAGQSEQWCWKSRPAKKQASVSGSQVRAIQLREAGCLPAASSTECVPPLLGHAWPLSEGELSFHGPR